MASTYDRGDTVRLSATFRDDAGAFSDPTTVVLKVKKPDGTTSTFTYALAQITKDSVGNYHKDIAVDQSG